MFSNNLPQLFSTGPMESPTKRRRIDSRSGSGVFGGSSFRRKVSGIVGKKKLPPSSAAGGGIGDEKRAQKKIDEYFGWGAVGGIDEELAGILEGVMGEVEEEGEVVGFDEQGREREEEREQEREAENQRERNRGIEREKERENLDRHKIWEGGSVAGGGRGGDEDGVMKDYDEVEKEVEDEVGDGNHYGGRVYAWLTNSGHDDPGSDVTNISESESEATEPEDEKGDSNVPQKAGEDLAAMVERLNEIERRERKEQSKRKKRRRKDEAEDEDSEEDLDLLSGKRVKRRRENLEDEHRHKGRQLATPESTLARGTPDVVEGTPQSLPLARPEIIQASPLQRLAKPIVFGPHFFTTQTSDRYTHLLNTIIRRYLTHAIYPSGGEAEDTANPDSAPLEASYVLGSYWTSDEKQRFFNHLATKGRHDLPGISEGVATKSIIEVRAYLKALEEGLRDVKLYVRRLEAQNGDDNVGEDGETQGSEGEIALMRYEDIPAAVEISEELEAFLEKHAEQQEKEILGDEVEMEKEKWGGDGRWLVGLPEAEKMDAFWAGKNSKNGNADESVPSPHPETELLKIHTLLRLSQAFFMLPKPPPGNPLSEVIGDGGTPAIRLTTLQDLHNLAVSLARKLVQASIFVAKNRIQSKLVPEKLVPHVRASDVKVAARVMGLGEADKKGFWIEWVRRSGIGVRDRSGGEMEPEQIERELLSKIGDLKKRRDEQRQKVTEVYENEEIDGTAREGGEGRLDEDGDREMGEASPPPEDLMEQNAAGKEEGEGGEGEEEEVDDDSEDSEHAREDEIHIQTDSVDLIASAKAELALWKDLLPENVSPPEEVVKRLQDFTDQPLWAFTDDSLSPSSLEDSERSLSDSEASTSTSGSNSASASASAVDSSDVSATSDTTPLSTSFIVRKQLTRQRRRRRLLEDWDENWEDSYPCYAAWAAKFKRPGGIDYGFAGEAEGSWSGDDDDDVTDASSARRFGERGRENEGRSGMGVEMGSAVEDAQQPPTEQQQHTSITPTDSPQPAKRGIGRPRKHPLKFDVQGNRIRPSKSDRPIGRPRLTEEQLLERAKAKLPRGRRRKGPFAYAGLEGLEGRHIPNVKWRPEDDGMEDEIAIDEFGDCDIGGEDVEMTGGGGKEVGKEVGKGMRVMSIRSSGRQRSTVERVGMISTVQAVIEAEKEVEVEGGDEGDGDEA